MEIQIVESVCETVSKKWYKSKIILLQVLQSFAIYMQTNGEEVLNQVNTNLSQFEVYLPEGMFKAISIACIIATIYYRFKPSVAVTK